MLKLSINVFVDNVLIKPCPVEVDYVPYGQDPLHSILPVLLGQSSLSEIVIHHIKFLKEAAI